MTKLTTWQATIQDDDTGAAIVSPVVTIRLGGPAGALADLFDIAGAPVANPVTGGLDGFVQVQMRPGRYWVQAADGGTFSNAWYIDVMPEEGLSWATRAELVTDWAAGMNLPDGAVINAGGLQYEIDSAATAISDLVGVKPFGDVYPGHFATNSTPGTTDMGAAIQAADDYCLANKVPLHWNGETHYFDPAVTQLLPSAAWVGEAVISVGAKSSTNNSYAISGQDGFRAEAMSLTFAANNNRGIQLGSNSRVGTMTLENSVYNTVDDNIDACLVITGDKTTIDNFVGSNHAKLVKNTGDDNKIKSFLALDCVTGINNSGSRFQCDSAASLSANVNATTSPGHNVVLDDAGDGSFYGYVFGNETGEHTFRIGGSTTRKGPNIGKIVSINPGGNHFKCAPDIGQLVSFTLGSVEGYDAGSGTLTIARQDVGVLVERCLNSSIGRIKVDADTVTRSSFCALEVNDISGLDIASIEASDVVQSFITIRPYTGDVNGLNVSSLVGSNSDQVAVLFAYIGTGNDVRDVSIKGRVDGVTSETIRVINQVDGTYTAADYVPGGVDPGGAGTIAQGCFVDLITENTDDIDGNADNNGQIAYTIRGRSTTAGPSRFVSTGEGRCLYYLNNMADDSATTIALPPRSQNAVIKAFEANSTAGAFVEAVGSISTTSALKSVTTLNAAAVASDGILAGTSGTDGLLTIRLSGTTLYVENRRGEIVDAIVEVTTMTAR